MGNFMKAIRASTADVLALCDQDDIWAPKKLELCEAALETGQAWLVVHALTDFSVEANGVVRRSPPTFARTATIDGLQLSPNTIALGMCMVMRRSLLDQSEMITSLWEPRFDRISNERPTSNMDHWSHSHDMVALTLARLRGRIAMVGEVLAHHRVHQSNYSTVGSTWHQAADVANRLGQGQHVSYQIQSQFCTEFGEFILECQQAGLVRPERAAIIRESYDRWASRWSARARLHVEGAPFPARYADFKKLLALGSYGNSWDGGLGWRSFAKDGLAMLGVRVG
jgi:hypothetical protein